MTHLPLPLPFTIVGEDPAGSMTQASPSPSLRDSSISTDSSISPPSTVKKWKDLSTEEREQLESLMPRVINQRDGALHSHSRVQSSGKGWKTYYKCRWCDAKSQATVPPGEVEATMKMVRPHTCRGGGAIVSSLLVVDYKEQMRREVAERAYVELGKSPLMLASEIYRKFDSLGNEEGGVACHFVTYIHAYIYIYINTYIYTCIYVYYHRLFCSTLYRCR